MHDIINSETNNETRTVEKNKHQKYPDTPFVSKNGLGIELPNGKYRYVLKFSTKSDPYFYFLQWQLDTYDAFGEKSF